MIRFWATAKSLQIPVKARVLEAICLEQTWPLSLIRELSASIFLSVQELVLHMFLSLCLSVTLSLALIIIVRAPFCTPSSASSSFVILHFPSLTTLSPTLSLPLALAPSFSLQAAREKESSQAQLKALSQQTEAARRELAEILGRLAQREEELHRKDVELSETRQRQLSLEQEIREVWGWTSRNR